MKYTVTSNISGRKKQVLHVIFLYLYFISAFVLSALRVNRNNFVLYNVTSHILCLALPHFCNYLANTTTVVKRISHEMWVFIKHTPFI
jgi:hypothetical protein